jgi:uncharacterized membrane protein YccC
MVWAGLPVSSWAFAVRIWLAIVVALYAGFWLELEAPSSAAITVAILALPTRGQAMEKAIFRLIATIVGVAASIAIVGLFTQLGDLLLGAFAVWIGICVYAVGLLDGSRAYAAALSGYTVGLIAVQQIDNPQHLFESGMARGAAIAVGVLAVTVVNDLLAAPDHHPHLAVQLKALHRRVAGYAQHALRGEIMPVMMAAGLLREIVALRPEVASLAMELNSGPARSAAARSAMVGLVAELFAARALQTLPLATALPLREEIISELDTNSSSVPDASLAKDPGKETPNLTAACLAWLIGDLRRTDCDVRRSLDALGAGRRPPREWRAPLYRSHRIAAESGIRAAAYFVLVAAIFAIGGWPATEAALSFVVIIIGLGATTPDLRAFTTIAVVAAPVASLMTGLLEFVVLDGVTEFPLLAIGLAPFMIGSALLMTLPNRILSGLGRFNLIFILALLAPSNPQSYNPQTFLFSVLFLSLATGLLFAVEYLIPPVPNVRRQIWLLASARHDLALLPCRHQQHLLPEEAMFRDAGRIAKMLAASDDTPQNLAAMEEAIAYFDQAATLRLCHVELDRLAMGPLHTEVNAAYAALVQRDARSILAAAHALREATSFRNPPVIGASAALLLASVAFRPAESSVTEFLAEKAP